MDCYDEMVVLLTQVVGGWFATQSLDKNVHSFVRADRAGLSGPLDLRNASDLLWCLRRNPQLPRCRQLVRSLAADDDNWLYQTAAGRFAAQLQQAEANPGTRQEAASAKVMARAAARGQRGWPKAMRSKGGARRWRRREDKGAARGRHPCSISNMISKPRPLLTPSPSQGTL